MGEFNKTDFSPVEAGSVVIWVVIDKDGNEYMAYFTVLDPNNSDNSEKFADWGYADKVVSIV